MRVARVALATAAIAAVGVLAAASMDHPDASGAPGVPPLGIHKIKHVIMIVQENRSFDSYFGTFPGADGIPMSNGVATACLPDMGGRRCVRPYPDHADSNAVAPTESRPR